MRARRLLGAVALAAVLVGAAGCGSGSSGGTDGGTGGTVKQGGIFTLGSTNYIDTLNVFNYIEAGATVSFIEIYPELVQYSPGLKSIVPSFAESWTISPDGKTYTFKLHPGAKWSDGKPLTSADVAWTANTIIKYPGPTAVLASGTSTRATTART
jgi:peptide/nickel transport system substrate-binding protein